MVLVGTDDGVYHLTEPSGSRTAQIRTRLASGRVHRLRQFPGVEGVFAASTDGLYYAPDGDEWTRLGIPQEKVYAVGLDADSGRLYAGTRPAHVYAADAVNADGSVTTAPDWTELTGIQELPSRGEWRLPRHDDLAQVRDVKHDGERLVVGVEVGGVIVAEGGDYRECEGVYDDVHELHVVAPGEYVAATGRGLYHTTDTGWSWQRLDEEADQRYFRRAHSVDGTVYAAGALSNSSTWNDPEADPALFAVRDGDVAPVPLPRDDETVTGMATLDGSLLVATHLGSLFHRRDGAWHEYPPFPVIEGEVTGRYTPISTL